MNRRKAIAGGLAAALALVLYWIFSKDPDREAIERFAACFTGEMTREKTELALTYTDPTAVTLEVSAFGEERAYGPDEAEAFRTRARAGAASLHGSRRAIQQRIEIHRPAATLWMRLLGDDGMAEVTFTFRKVGARWRVERARVH